MSVINDIATELHNIKSSITTALGNKGVKSSGKWVNFKSEIEAIVPTFEISSSFKNMDSMFSGCTSLTSVPLFNTGSVTSMEGMFSGCTSLTSVPEFNTASVTSMDGMFYSCTSLTSVPEFNTASVTSMDGMFYSCTSLTSVPLFNTGSVTSMDSMFSGCTSLTSVPLFNTGSVTNMNNMFYNCTSLTSVDMYGMKVSFDLRSCKKLSTEEINKIFDNCGQAVSGAIITLPNTANAKSADNSIATAKGWNIVYA